MDKRAQVTLFVIVSIVAVAIVSVFLMFQAGIVRAPISPENAKTMVASQSENLRDYSSKCIKEISLNYFREAMLQGGYYNNYNLDAIYDPNTGESKTIIVFKDNEGTNYNILPPIENICGNGFGSYMDNEGYDKLDDCVKDFSTFRKFVDVKPATERKISAECNADEIMIEADWDVTISRADSSTTIRQKSTKLYIPIKDMWDLANRITNDEANNKDYLSTEIEEDLYNHQYSTDSLVVEGKYYPTYKQTIIYITADTEAGEEYKFDFAIDREKREEFVAV